MRARLILVALAGVGLLGCEDPARPVAAPPTFQPPRLALASGTETPITTDPADQFSPDISGDRVVWEDLRHGNFDIYMFDLASGTETRITAEQAHPFSPAISGDRIVWHVTELVGPPGVGIYARRPGAIRARHHAERANAPRPS